MSSREAILEKLHHAVPDTINKNIITMPEQRPGDADVFTARATAAGARVTTTKPSEAAEAIRSVLQETGCQSIILSEEKIIKTLEVQSIASDLGIECRYTNDFPGEAYRRNIFKVQGGISGCDYALADSGSLVILHNYENQRLISLAPETYIGIVKTSQMLKDRFDLASLLEKGDKTAAVTFITGVSRTADVALQVVLGMHGPRQVYIILIED
jgi:L-lactate dehydrogenase complex protein LldG